MTINALLTGPDTPVGITLGTKTNANIDSNVIAGMKDLGIRWLRWQPYWAAVEATKGTFVWGNLDKVVQACNAAGINILIVATFGANGAAPSWAPSGPPQPADVLRYAKAMTDRYNGNNGVGQMQALELCNEDFDNGSNKPFQPLADVMNGVYPTIKAKYPNMTIGPACTLQRNASHIQAFWTGMFAAAGGHFDYVNSHYYTCIPTGSPYDPSITSGNIPSFAQNLSILQGCANAAGHPGFPIWITETGYAVNSNFGYRCPSSGDIGCVTSQQTQANYMKYELDQLRGLNQPAKFFWFNLSYLNINPSCGVGTSQGMSLFQGPAGSGFQTTAYGVMKNYPKNWGGGSSTGLAQRDWKARARVRSGAATVSYNWQARARLKTLNATTQIRDWLARARLDGGFVDTFIRSNQTNWGVASGGLNWVQAGGTAQPSVVGNKGQITGAVGTNTMRLGTGTQADGETQVRVNISRAGDIVGLNLRDSGLNSFVRLRLTASQLQLVQQTPAGGFVTLASYAFVPTITTNYVMKFRATGASLLGKIWTDGNPEPDWLLAGTATLLSAGQVGLSVALSLAADIVLFDQYSATDAVQNSAPPTSKARDWKARARLIARSTTQQRDWLARARIVDLNGITVTTSAVKRRPLDRRFPKS